MRGAGDAGRTRESFGDAAGEVRRRWRLRPAGRGGIGGAARDARYAAGTGQDAVVPGVRPVGLGKSGMNPARAFGRASGRTRRFRGVAGQGVGAAGGAGRDTREPGTARQDLGSFRVAPARTVGYQERGSQHPPVSVPPVPYPSRQVGRESGGERDPPPTPFRMLGVEKI